MFSFHKVNTAFTNMPTPIASAMFPAQNPLLNICRDQIEANLNNLQLEFALFVHITFLFSYSFIQTLV